MGPEYYTRPAVSAEDRAMVMALRCEAFATEGASMQALKDRYEEAPHSQPHLLFYRGADAPIGSIRTCLYSDKFDWRPVPAFDLYRQEIEDAYGAEVSLLQSTHFCVSAGHRAMALLPKLVLLRELLRTAICSDAAHVITIVKNQPSQLRFYRRMGFEPRGPARIHPLPNREGVLIAVATDTFRRTVRASRTLHPIGDF